MSFNAVRPNDTTQRYLVGADHCTSSNGADQNDEFFQPARDFQNPQPLGTEYLVSSFRSGLPGCLTGHLCRYSDAALFKYDSTALAGLGVVARPLHYTTWWRAYTITRDTVDFVLNGELPEAFFVSGEWLSKVGKETGWSTGKVDQTCFTVHGAGGSAKDELCQYSVYDFLGAGSTFVDAGDSGSPVLRAYYSEDDVYGGYNWLGGILTRSIPYSGNPSVEGFVFSAIARMKVDLGDFRVTTGPTCIAAANLIDCQ